MILALDIGNSNIKAALFEGLEQKTYFRISCDRNKSSDEYGVTLLSMLRHAGYSPKDVTGIVFPRWCPPSISPSSTCAATTSTSTP